MHILLANHRISLKTCLVLILFLVAVYFTRFYNLDHTARFTQDESSDLLRMHQYWQEKKITLVGPISNDNTKVFGSLTYYMLMPFAAAFGFSPIAPVYGMAFWGVLTALLLVALARVLNPKLTLIVALISLIWYPLLETSRWAWNPHFVIFWPLLAGLVYHFRKRLGGLGYWAVGFFLGLPFHHHYIAIFATTTFIILIAIRELSLKQFKNMIFLISGFIASFLPFVIFDLRHPPGLFFGKYLLSGNTPHVISPSATSAVANLAKNISVMGETLLPGLFMLQILIIILSGLLALADLKQERDRLVWFIPVIAQIVGGIVLTEYQSRYFLPAVGFFIIWLVLKRTGIARWLAHAALATILVGSLFTVVPQLIETTVHPNIYSLTKASEYIAGTIKKENLKNTNVAALSSRDSAPLAERYRDVLTIHGINMKQPSEYDTSEHLFVVSQATNYDELSQDKSTAMHYFRKAVLKESYVIENTDWKVYWLSWFD